MMNFIVKRREDLFHRERSSDSSRVSERSLSHLKHRPDIDGLRALAIILVVVSPATPLGFKGGFIGVDIFFVISGYLISIIIFFNLENRDIQLQGILYKAD